MNLDVLRYPAESVQRALAHFPTPFYLYDEATIRRNCHRLVTAFSKHFSQFQPLYAVKANPNPHVVRIVMNEGFGLDCSSPSELWLSRRFGAPGMHTGNYQTREELREIIAAGNLILNLDDESLIDEVREIGMPTYVSLRINPGISQGSMESLLLAGPDAKFGVPWEHAARAYRRLQDAGVKKFGIHMMTGSNVLDPEYFALVARKLMTIAASVQREVGIVVDCMNIGGGFGVPYRPDESTLDLNQVAVGVYGAIEQTCRGNSLLMPQLFVEPGRLITADAGFLVTRVHVVKDGYKRFAGVDAGMNDFPRPSMYGAYHHISVLGKNSLEPTVPLNVVGRLCENNDQFARDRALPPVEVGDVLIFHNAGAHCHAMGHNYNGRPRCAEVMVSATGELRLIRRAETTEDLLRNVCDF